MAKTFRLANGVICVCEERPQSGMVEMIIGIKSGSAHDTPDLHGLANLMQEATWGGTTTRSRDQIADEIESKGGSFRSNTSKSTTTYEATALTRDAATTFAILADVLRNPAFDAAEVQKARESIGYSIDSMNQNPGAKAGANFMSAAFSGQSIALPVLGTKDLVNNFTLSQIKARHAEMLARPQDMVVSFCGDIDAATAEQLVAKHFGDLIPGAPRKDIAPVFTGGDIRESNNNKQLNILFGVSAPSLQDPKRFHLMMLNQLISGGMSSPLFVEVREKRGLVYSVGASYSPMEDAGTFYINAGTGKGNAGQLIPVALEVLGTAVRKGFTDDELKQARERIMRSSRGALESAGNVCVRNASQILSYGRLVPLDATAAELAKVTSDDIRSTLSDILASGNYALGCVGPLDSMPDPKAIRAMFQAQALTVPASTLKTSFAAVNDNKSRDAKVTVLPNGMMVVSAERPGNMTCGAWVGAGSDHETLALNGATHMNEHMMFKGTPSYGPGVIDKTIESEMGGGLNAYTSRDQTAYYFYNLLPEHMEKTIAICGEMVFKANIAHDEFDGKITTNPDGSTTKAKGERDVVIEEILRADDNIGNRLWDLLSRTMSPGQSHGRPVLGTEANIRAMTVGMLSAYRDEFYVPNNVVFSAAGPIKHEDFVTMVERQFGHMPSRVIQPLPTPVYHSGVAHTEMATAELCQFILATKGIPNNHPDDYAYEALREILSGGASSRLHKTLVNTSLTNGISAGMQSFRNAGTFLFSAAIDAANMKKVTEIIYQELRGLVNTVSQEELDKAKAQMEMNTLAGLQTNMAVCRHNGGQVLSTGKAETSAEMSAQIKNVTLADVQRVAKEILASDPVLAMVVPPGTDKALLPDLAEVIALRDKPLATLPQSPVLQNKAQP